MAKGMTSGDIEKILDEVEFKVRKKIREEGYILSNDPYVVAKSMGITYPIQEASIRGGTLSVTILP